MYIIEHVFDFLLNSKKLVMDFINTFNAITWVYSELLLFHN